MMLRDCFWDVCGPVGLGWLVCAFGCRLAAPRGEALAPSMTSRFGCRDTHSPDAGRAHPSGNDAKADDYRNREEVPLFPPCRTPPRRSLERQVFVQGAMPCSPNRRMANRIFGAVCVKNPN